MTQSEEIPAEPIPAQPAPPAQPAQPSEFPQQSGAPAPMPTEPVYAAPAQAEYPLAAAEIPPLSPEEQAAAAAKKAKRRMLFAKSAVLAVPAVALVSLLVVSSLEASALSTKTTAASTAAKAATAAGGLVPDLHAAQSAAEASILVDAGCVAAESLATGHLETKLLADGKNLDTASNGTSFSAFTIAVNDYVNDLQALSTDLQQDAALSSRASVKTAINTVNSDLRVVISTMQDALAGNFSVSAENKFNAAANRMDGDGTAVDTLCGGSTLEEGGSDSSSSDNGTTNA